MCKLDHLGFSAIAGAILCLNLFLTFTGCGSSAPSSGPGYTLAASALTPNSITAGASATSTITLTPVDNYSGSVKLSCGVTGGTPAPTCYFNLSPVMVAGPSPATTKLTVSTTGSTPGGSYTIVVSASDAKDVAPSNGTQTLTMTTAGVIRNVVIIFQENRTPDNLFQDQNLINAGADIQNYGINSLGQTVPLTQIDLGTVGTTPDNYDLSHAHAAFVDMCNLNSSTNTCAMDGADKVPISCASGAANCPPANAQFMYVNPADVAAYFQMAETYSFADHMFQTNQGPSFPAHQFIISGTSAPETGSVNFVAENPTGVTGANSNTGCTAPASEYVEEIDPAGVENQTTFPCFEHETLTDLLDAAGLSWRYYAPSLGSLWTAPTAIDHMCQPNGAQGSATACSGSDYTGASPKVVLNQSQANAQILSDISSNQLQQVSWVIPDGDDSDHALSNNGCGPSWVTSIVNAIGQSPYWSNTAIVITWDDWGGWYDHVPPPLIDNGTSWGSGYLYGFRVPMIVISPYAKAGYISHTTHDFGSILKFIETTFSLPSLGYADAHADDLSDIFQYTHAPVPFTQITPPSDTASCVTNTNGATDPDDE
jgi:phospholipase C